MAKKKYFNRLSARDDRRLVNPPTSTRHPAHVLARIMTIAELENRSRSDIINELLAVALDVYESEIPSSVFNCPPEEFLSDPDILPYGPKVEFQQLANKHFQELDAKFEKPSPSPLYTNEEIRGC